jgi:hypothetical protein
MAQNFSKIFSNFLKSIIKKSQDNNKYLKYYSTMVNDDQNNINFNMCYFLNSYKINDIIETEFTQSSRYYQQKYEETGDHILASKYQYEKFVKKIDELEIEPYITNKSQYNNLINKMEKILGKKLSIFTVGDLRKIYELICNDYFNNKIIKFINDFNVDEQNKLEKIERLKKWPNTHGLTFDTSKGGIVHYPHSYLAYTANFGIMMSDPGISLRIFKDSANIKISTIYNFPNIQFFCSTQDSVDEIIPYVTNRFAYLHEFGHHVLFDSNTTVKINNVNYYIPELNGPNTNFPKAIISDLTENEIKLAGKYNLDSIFDINNSPLKIIDLNSDYLATSVIVDELRQLNKTDLEILYIMAKIFPQLGTADSQHFSSHIRFYLNVYLNDFLLNAYDSNVEQGKPEIPIDNIISEIKNKLAQLNASESNSIISLIDRLMAEGYKIHFDTDEEYRNILETYYEKDISWYKDNLNKINKYFQDIDDADFDYEGWKNTYKRKYLKYKQKYLTLKKLNK